MTCVPRPQLTKLVRVILFFILTGSPVHAVPATSFVGEMTVGDEVTFIRVGPQILGNPELSFHRPNDLVFNEPMRDVALTDDMISLGVIGENGAVSFRLEGDFGADRYVGTVEGSGADGIFELFPVVSPPNNTVLGAYSGTYELGDGSYRTVGFEDLAGLVDTRLYYSDGENFVLMYPLSASTFYTGKGELIRFQRNAGVVSGMTVLTDTVQHSARKVVLFGEADVTFENDGAALAATLLTPMVPGPHPAAIIAHSSAGGERHANWIFATQLARDGVAVLAYDRRGHGRSTGGDPFNLDTDILALDMAAGYAYLQSRQDIDATRIGLLGFSNGSWVAARAAQQLPDVAFLSVSMASAVSQIDAELFRRESVLRASGISEEAIAQVVEALELYFEGSVSSFSEEEKARFAEMYTALGANEELQSVTGFRILPTDTPLEEIVAAAGSLEYMAFSPSQAYLDLDAPIDFHVGEFDENIPAELSIAAMNDVVSQRPDADINLVVHPGAAHGLYVLPAAVQGISQDVLYPNLASFEFAPGYMQQLRSWIAQQSVVWSD